MKLLGYITFAVFVTSITMIDGIYEDIGFKLMLATGAMLIAMGIVSEKKGAASGETLNDSKDFNPRRF